MTTHTPLPVRGYTAQSSEAVELVNRGKELEERVLRYLDDVLRYADAQEDDISDDWEYDINTSPHRWLNIGRSNIQQGFMAAFRAVFNPQRTKLPEDETDA